MSSEPVAPVLDATMREQLKTLFENIQFPIELAASLEDDDTSRRLYTLLEELAGLSDKIGIRDDGNDPRKPSFTIARIGEPPRICFAGIPLGHELSSLALALLQTGGHPPKVEAASIERVRALQPSLRLETYVSLHCRNCPETVQALNTMAVLNPRIEHTMIDGSLFKNEIEHHGIDTVPSIYLNGKRLGQGRKTLEDALALIDGALGA